MKKLRLFLLILASVVNCHHAAAGKEPYVTAGDCDGFAKIEIPTLPNLCAGLVASHLGFPRGVAAIGSNIYVLDMGGWRTGHGKLLLLSHYGKGKPEVLLDHIDEPNALILAPHSNLYIGILGKVVLFNPATKKLKDVVINLPSDGLHPLSALAMAADGSLYINIGAASDNCEKADGSPPDPHAPCPETIDSHPARGSIIHIEPQASPIDAHTITPYATGLRNSMALAVSPSGQLYAAVNARDAIDKAATSLSDEDLPHDTFDEVREGDDFGWPYCYDNNVASPEYADYVCSTKHLPASLIPPHAAPLGMLFYKGDYLSGLEGKLIMGYHGYRAEGHRVVAFSLSEKGALETPVELVNGWNVQPGNHPQGAPVSLFEMDDGSILITEDQNGTLLRLSRARQ